jgi:hypothetical protein
MKWNIDRFWHATLPIAVLLLFVSVVMDRVLVETMFHLWEQPTPWRLLFFSSLTVLLLGLARNSSRLRSLSSAQTSARDHSAAQGYAARTVNDLPPNNSSLC